MSAALELAPKHIKQIEVLDDPTRFKFLLAGRRGGKTAELVEEIAEGLRDCPNKGEIFYIGPTNQDAMSLIWEKVIDRLDELNWSYNAKISKQCIELSRGRKFYVIGAEKIRRIRGHKVYKVLLDEVAFFSAPLKEIWKAVRPALSDLRGKAVLATTPNGKGTDAYEFYLDILNKEDWKYFQWFTEDNPYISREEIESAKKELDAKSYNQEYRASWESFEGLAYYSFDEQLHIKPQPEISFLKPIILGFDFNVNPTTLLVAQKEDDLLRFKREWSQSPGSTEDTVEEFCEWLIATVQAKYAGQAPQILNQVMIKLRGDSTGGNRKSNTGKSDYYYVEEVLKKYKLTYVKEVPSVNPSIIDRVKHMNSYLMNVHGKHRVEVDPSCKLLIKDFTSQKTNGRVPDDAGNLGHKADAAGYVIYWDFKNSKPILPPTAIRRGL